MIFLTYRWKADSNDIAPLNLSKRMNLVCEASFSDHLYEIPFQSVLGLFSFRTYRFNFSRFWFSLLRSRY